MTQRLWLLTWPNPDMGFPHGSDGKESSSNVGDLGLIRGSGRSPGEGKDYPLQYACLENPHGQRWGHRESDMTEHLSTEHIVVP